MQVYLSFTVTNFNDQFTDMIQVNISTLCDHLPLLLESVLIYIT